MNKYAKVLALASALSKKVTDGEFVVVDELTSTGKTKEMAAVAKALGLTKSALIVMDNADEKVIRAAANLPKISTLPVEQINTYDVVKNAKVVFTKGAVERLVETYVFEEVDAE